MSGKQNIDAFTYQIYLPFYGQNTFIFIGITDIFGQLLHALFVCLFTMVNIC